MSRAANPFSPRAMLAVLAVGAASFILLLYALGAGWTGRNAPGGHAAANGLDGYSALASMLERLGQDVRLSRNRGALDEEALMILTPPLFADGEDIWDIVERRRYTGPTIIILPKWFSFEIPDEADVEKEDGWVLLATATSPHWPAALEGFDDGEAKIDKGRSYRGLGLSGPLPEPDQVQAFASLDLVPLVEDASGRPLAGYLDDGGYYPVLAEAADIDPGDEGDDSIWPVVVVAEPDLMNNYGFADRDRAELAVELVEATLEDYDLPIVFDLTMAGLGGNANLLTLAFTPPYLAATLCLLLAAMVIAWRAFLRFGPPLSRLPGVAGGKAELARNGASLVERARRVHLLGAPYAALVTARMARALGLRPRDADQREMAIARALERRGEGSDEFHAALADLRGARKPRELLRAASALTRIERTLKT